MTPKNAKSTTFTMLTNLTADPIGGPQFTPRSLCAFVALALITQVAISGSLATGSHPVIQQRQSLVGTEQHHGLASSFPLEQQLNAALVAVASQAGLAASPLPSPSSISKVADASSDVSSQSISSSAPSSSSNSPSTGRSRTPRSIGEMFKKLFTGSKRSKTSQSNRNEWDQQQQYQQQQQQQQQFQQQQLQQQQSQAMAAQLAAAAANQHAVYASPFATYAASPQSASSPASAAVYSQFSPYSGAGLLAWPTTANLAQALRGTPTLISGPSAPAMAPTLYAAASQSYNSYVPPPPSVAANAAAQSAQNSVTAAQLAATAGPSPAASHAHASAVPAPAGMGGHGGGSPSSLDFHQVLDALVRTSGFAPAGDQEAAAAQGYNSKSDGTPVFSFKKLVSLPFYLSTEDKSLDGLANAMAPGGGYSMHSMPLMRRHVRRMSTPSVGARQQQLAGQQQSLSSYMDSQLQRSSSEQAQQQHYTNYFDALNNQLANNQMAQYLSQQQETQTGNGYDSYSPETATALANYQAALNALSGVSSPVVQKASASPLRNQISGSSNTGNNLAMAASVNIPTAVQAPHSLLQQQQQHQQQVSAANNQQQINQRQQYADQAAQQQEIQNFLNSIQQQQSGASEPSQASQSSINIYSNWLTSQTGNGISPFVADGHRLGAAQPQQQYYWNNNQQQLDGQQQHTPASVSSMDYVINTNTMGGSSAVAAAVNSAIDAMQQQQQQQAMGYQDQLVGSSSQSVSQSSPSSQAAGSQAQSSSQSPQQQPVNSHASSLQQVANSIGGGSQSGSSTQLGHSSPREASAEASGNNHRDGQQQQQQHHNSAVVAPMANFSPISNPHQQQQQSSQSQQQAAQQIEGHQK